MMDLVLIIITLSAMFLVVYHHALYPLVLNYVEKRRSSAPVHFRSRRYEDINHDGLPSICIIIPAFNEADWIAEKIHNLAFLDYPENLLQVVVACDGCTDNTAEIARESMRQLECSELNIEVIEFSANRGKIAVLNDLLLMVNADLIALSDVSALISVDALMIAAEHFKDPRVGVVNSHYRILHPGSEGEANYWKYQSKIKSSEAALGATLGAHGAFYVFRHDLADLLEKDIINDDFVLPMKIVAKGYLAKHDNRILALELEKSHQEMDIKRRMRISAGNLQQLIRLRSLLLPRYKGIAFAFASGKALRVTMPFMMIIALLGSFLLRHYAFFSFCTVAQVFLYSLALAALYYKQLERYALLKTLSYIVSGHVSSLCGSMNYIFAKHRGPWKRVRGNSVQ